MAMSPYLRALRERVGSMRLLLPSASATIHDGEGRLLLVRQRDSGIWSTPGGMIEPDENPADAVIRETWEETGLLVSPRRVMAVWGGPGFVVRYPNGDEVQYVIIAFDCEIVGGELRADEEETVEARFWSHTDAAPLPLSPWLRPVLAAHYAADAPQFISPARRPPPV